MDEYQLELTKQRLINEGNRLDEEYRNADPNDI